MDEAVVRARERAPFRAYPVIIITVSYPPGGGVFEADVCIGPDGHERVMARLSGHGEHHLEQVVEAGQWVSVRWADLPGRRRAIASIEWTPAA